MTATLATRRLEVTRDLGLAPGGGAARRRFVARLTLDHLRKLWAPAVAGFPTDGIALGSVGSLARKESGPLSDLDLVLVHDGRGSADRINQLADALWYPLWESGLRLDHSVRTLADCRAVAEQDLPALVGLLDITAVAGDEALIAGVRMGVARDWRAAARRRLPMLVTQVRDRHASYGDLADLLEPDVKEAHGGLRDVTLMRVLTAAWLTDRPHADRQDAAVEQLLDVRDAIHLVGGRGRERLLRQDRDAVAALLSFGGPDDLLAAVSDAGRQIALATDSTLRRAEQTLHARRLRVGPRTPVLRPLGHGVYEHDGEAVLGADALRRHRRSPGGDPAMMLRACTAAARAGLPLAAATVDSVAATSWDSSTWTVGRREQLMAFLATGPGLRHVWEQLTVAGVIGRWIPAWNRVRSRPQHDPLHRHTVDRHQVETVVECASALDEVRRPDLLLVAALLHDIGKADGGAEHPRTGAPVARDAAAGLGFNAADAHVVEVLVAQHLTLMELATTRDPDDLRTVQELLGAVDHEVDLLRLLAALTRADAVSVGERAWTPWRARLVTDLVARASARLAARASGQRAGGETGRATTMAPPEHAGMTSKALPTSADRAAALAGTPVVRVRSGQDPATVVVEVVAVDHLGLFGEVAGALAAQRVAVRRAVLCTDDGVAYDTWECDGDFPLDTDRIVGALIRERRPVSGGVRSAAGRSRTAGDGPGPQVLLLPGGATSTGQAGQADRATVVELWGADRPGLLRDVGRALADVGVAVLQAQVETHAGRCRDVFTLEAGGGPLDPPWAARAVTAIMDAAG